MPPSFIDLIEQKILEAQRNGGFDNLPGQGKKLVLEEDAGIPDELRVAYRVLKNAGAIPQEVHLMNETTALKERVKSETDPGKREQLMKDLREMQLRLTILLERTRQRD